MNPVKKNISLNEIKKFNDFSVDWWNKTGRMKSLHDINPLRLDYILRQTRLENLRVLDVGCGGGILTESVTRLGAITTGIDASADMIAIARSHAETAHLDIRYIHTDIERFTRDTQGGFDVILCMELLEHVPDFESVISSCKALLNPGGIVVFATINRTVPAFFLAIICAEYILGLLPRGTHTYASLIRPDELENACTDAGLRKTDITGFSYNPFSREYYLCKNIRVNYLACFKPV